jgi:hypothetical protein
LTECAFTGNSDTGGGIYQIAADFVSPTTILNRCTFVRNFGAIEARNGAVIAANNCTFLWNGPNNAVEIGGDVALVNCRFISNLRDGLSVSYPGSLSAKNCTFAGNSPGNNAGGALNSAVSTVMTNCIVWGNSGRFGSQIALYGAHAYLAATYSDIEGGWPGVGNIDVAPSLSPDGHLLSGSPCVDSGTAGGAPTIDLDEEVRPAGAGIDMGSDEFSDTDSDGLPDHWEAKYFGSTTSAAGSADADSDGLANMKEFAAYSSNPIAPPIYVCNSCNSTPDGSRTHPYGTIQAGIDAAHDGDTILVLAGTYAGAGNRALDLAGKSIILRSWNGTDPAVVANATLDCGNVARAFQVTSAPGAVQGFTITHAEGPPGDVGGGAKLRDSRLMLENCFIVNSHAPDGGGIYCDVSSPTIDNLTLGSGNTALGGAAGAGVWRNSSVNLLGNLELSAGLMDVYSSSFYGPGHIELAPGSVLRVNAFAPTAADSIVRSNIIGRGDIEITSFSRLMLESGATIDLSGQTSPACGDPSESVNWGTITVDGVLEVHDASIRNSNVDVRLADLHGATAIINNDIRLVEASAGYGGQFFVDGNATIECNVITSEGDRYLDCDPDPDAVPRPTIGQGPTANKFNVVIKQGQLSDQGELLELRTRDFDVDTNGGVSGAYHLAAGGQGYEDPWGLESLVLKNDAKLNLTNRQGFDFVPQDATPEALYVKTLQLGADSLLNTGLQVLYYQNLVDGNGGALVRDPQDPYAPLANGARFVDIPVLGFSLKVIAMDDDVEFGVRVQNRVRDPLDVQVCQCAGVCPNDSPPLDASTCKEGSIARIVDPFDGDNGIMRVQTRAVGRIAAASVAAHGSFARAGEDEVLVEFKYRFCGGTAPAAALHVFLSDLPELRDMAVPLDVGQCSDDACAIAIVYPPAAGRPGSVGSSEWATFSGEFPRDGLNFTRGTYVELELRGPDTCVEIDDWDPQIGCSQTCHDLSGNNGVSNRDFLLLLAEVGQMRPANKGCLDSKISYNQYIDIDDVLTWDAMLTSNPAPNNLCRPQAGTTNSGTAVVGLPTSGLLVAGKPAAPGAQQDRLYVVDSPGLRTSPLTPADAAPDGNHRGNGRLVAGPDRRIYQVHATQGLLRLDDAARVLPPGSYAFAGKTVFIGVTVTGATGSYPNSFPNGVPLLDATFRPFSATEIYVAPVVVLEAGQYYKAAARVSVNGPAPAVTQLYGLNPTADTGCTNTVPPFASACLAQGQREIEVDDRGNVYVLSASAQSASNDWLLVYDEASGSERLRRLLTDVNAGLHGPSAMLWSQFNPDRLYISSAVDDDAFDPHTHVYACTIGRTGDAATGLSLAADLLINNPTSAGYGFGFLACVTALQEDPVDGALHVVGFTMPRFDPVLSYSDPLYDDVTGTIQALPTLAHVVYGTTGVTQAGAIMSVDLGLPVSAVLVPGLEPGDLDGDGDADLADYALFAACLGGPNQPNPGCPAENFDAADIDSDGDVDLEDYAALHRLLGTEA